MRQSLHQGRCDLPGHGQSLPLDSFVGADGLTQAVSFLSIGPLKLDGDLTGSSRGVESTDEFVDFRRRVQIPGYEEARRSFSEDAVRDRFSDANEYMPYMQKYLDEIIAGKP